MRKNTRNILKAMASIFGGLVLSIVIVEAGFRIFAIAFRPEVAEPDPNAYRILCLGDSSTFGQGCTDPARFSYPPQLECILKKANPGKPVQVINLGLPGINSSQAEKRLETFLPILSPHCVLVCVGINDPWNLEQSRLFEEYRGRGWQGVLLKIRSGLHRLKSFRFLRLVILSGNKPDYREPVPEFTALTVQNNKKNMPDALEFRRALAATLKHNFLTMRERAVQSGARIFFLEYHAPGWNHPETLIHELYRRLGLEYIPVFKTFLELDRGGYPVRGPDAWHPNDLGYLVLARIIATGLHGRLPIKSPSFSRDPESLVSGSPGFANEKGHS